jgi:CRP-like cAMP-binding protein
MSIQIQSFNPSIQRVGIVRSYARKSEIVREGDPADHLYEVVSGAVCTCRTLREGRRQITGFISQAMLSDWKAPKNTTSPPKRSPTLRFGLSKNNR